MADNIFESPGATPIHITMANNTRSVLATAMGTCQFGLQTDFVPHLVYKDHTGVLRDGVSGIRQVCFSLFESDETVLVSQGTAGFCVMSDLAGYNLVGAGIRVFLQGVGTPMSAQIRRNRNGSDDNMLATAITLGAAYYSANGVINASYKTLAEGDLIFVDVAGVHSSASAKGLFVTLQFGAY